jgi:hypothetical protein
MKYTQLKINKSIKNIELCEDQNEDISQLVKLIDTSDNGKKELDRIFQQAEESGIGRGELIKKVWDNDVSAFNADEQKNGNLSYVHLYAFMNFFRKWKSW